MTTIRSLILAIVSSIALLGQAVPARLEFEVASIKPSPPIVGVPQVSAGVHIDGAQVRFNMLSLSLYIQIAYRVKLYQVVGPEWLKSERFYIAAKLPDGSTREQVPDMLQALLADRFKVKLHRDTKDFPVYGLVVAKGGLRIKESPADLESESGDAAKGAVNVTANGGPGGTTINFGAGSYFTFANNRLEGKKLTMVQLADTLARFVDRPVVDATELKGNYDFTMEFSAEDYRAMMIRSALAAGVVLPPGAEKLLESASGDSLFTAIQTLGLKLDSRRAPLEVLVIDQMQKTPTEN